MDIKNQQSERSIENMKRNHKLQQLYYRNRCRRKRKKEKKEMNERQNWKVEKIRQIKSLLWIFVWETPLSEMSGTNQKKIAKLHLYLFNERCFIHKVIVFCTNTNKVSQPAKYHFHHKKSSCFLLVNANTRLLWREQLLNVTKTSIKGDQIFHVDTEAYFFEIFAPIH